MNLFPTYKEFLLERILFYLKKYSRVLSIERLVKIETERLQKENYLLRRKLWQYGIDPSAEKNEDLRLHSIQNLFEIDRHMNSVDVIRSDRIEEFKRVAHIEIIEDYYHTVQLSGYLEGKHHLLQYYSDMPLKRYTDMLQAMSLLHKQVLENMYCSRQ